MQIEKVRIKRCYVSDQNKEGKKFVAKNGKPYKKIAIQVQEYGDQFLTNFIFEANDPQNFWQAGDEREVLVSQSEDGKFLNFKIPTKLDRLEMRVEALESFLKGNGNAKMRDATQEEIFPEELNF